MHSVTGKRNFAAMIVLILAVLAVVFRMSNLLPAQILLAVLTPPVAWLLAKQWKQTVETDTRYHPSRMRMLSLPAALLLGAAAVVQLQKLWSAAVGTMAGAVCMGWVSYYAVFRKERPTLGYLLLSVSVALKLIPDFRRWSVDPVIIDYCFQVFAMLCFMLAALHLGGLLLHEGNERRTRVFCICGVVFCVMGAADGGAAETLTFLAYGIFLFTELWDLSDTGVEKESTPKSE